MDVTSRHNPLVRRIKRMQDKRRVRRKEKAFFVEGAQFVSLAAGCGARIETVVFSEPLLAGSAGLGVVADLRAKGVRCVSVSEEVFQAVSQRNNPDGLGAVVETRWEDLDSLAAGPDDVFVALVGISDPGNLGTVLRTIDAVGGAGCILVARCTDPFHPRTVRASKGALFTVPIARAADVETLLDWARRRGVHTVATSARGGEPYREAGCELPAAIVLGSEHEGLAQTTIEAADRLVTIPMRGSMSSLNVAVAASLLLYELKGPSSR